MLLQSGPVTRLGVGDEVAALRFGSEPTASTGVGRRVLWLGDEPAFELTFWCGSCPITFQRLPGANATLSVAALQDRLNAGLSDLDGEVVASFADLLPVGPYLPLLLRVSPQLVRPLDAGDYFAHEQLATWDLDSFWGLPENPRTPYYRTFETPAGPTTLGFDAHLFEFVVPMVPPTWNDRARVAQYVEQLAVSPHPTAVAVSTLDISQPAVDAPSDYYQHWALTHFLLDGHHKLEAAATSGAELQLLALVSVAASLATADDVQRLPGLLAQTRAPRSVRL